MKLLRAWAGLTALVIAAWLSVLLFIIMLNLLLPMVSNNVLRAVLGLILLTAWVAGMAVLVEVLRRRIAQKPAPESSAR
uniref:Uncharacterized protein n=1 Tax=Thermofilum pendens TaxID=2269 RepID=A0A7C4FE35_THEPE